MYTQPVEYCKFRNLGVPDGSPSSQDNVFYSSISVLFIQVSPKSLDNFVSYFYSGRTAGPDPRDRPFRLLVFIVGRNGHHYSDGREGVESNKSGLLGVREFLFS